MRRALAIGSSLLVLVLAGALARFDALVLWAMRPPAPFDPSATPPPPDYALAASWTALPDRDDDADRSVPALPAADQRAAPVDVFYVHPTSHVGRLWNAPVDNARLNADTDRGGARIQASAFNACCAVHGPRYRQANGTAFTHPSPDGNRAIDVAYGDVARAFRHFLSTWNRGRPFILAAHSQGSFLARRLLREEVSGRAVRTQLVAAYLPGAPWSLADLAVEVPDIPPCSSPAQVGCIASWNARGPGYVPGVFEFAVPGEPLCVNPLNWTTDGTAAEARENDGAVFLDSPAPAVLPHFVGARCVRGTLVLPGGFDAPRDFMSRLLDRALGAGNHHPIEYQLFFANLRSNAMLRADAFRAPRGAGR